MRDRDRPLSLQAARGLTQAGARGPQPETDGKEPSTLRYFVLRLTASSAGDDLALGHVATDFDEEHVVPAFARNRP